VPEGARLGGVAAERDCPAAQGGSRAAAAAAATAAALAKRVFEAVSTEPGPLMVDKVTITVTGAAEVEAALRELGARVANRIARSALNRAATPIVKRARELAPTPGDPDDPYATGAQKGIEAPTFRRSALP
jgi:hypothetical protein